MKTTEVLQAWGRILSGRAPSLSIEITKECPLRCPGCYAFDSAHLGGANQLRDLSDFKGDDLVSRVLSLIDQLKPLHVSLVGGDPLVRYRELDVLLAQLEKRGVYTQVVTSAFRIIPATWNRSRHCWRCWTISGSCGTSGRTRSSSPASWCGGLSASCRRAGMARPGSQCA